MITLTKEWLQQTIAELEEERDATPGAVNEDAAKALAAMKLALASLEAEKIAEPVAKVEAVGVCWYADNGVPRKPAVGTELYAAPPAPVPVPAAYEHTEDFSEYHEGWNACRAAMLQGAENAESRCTMQPASALDSLPQNAESRCSNSPVIPDGWVMVPAEPTQAMMNAWLSEVANWRGHAAGYRAMIAAAPQQEVK